MPTFHPCDDGNHGCDTSSTQCEKTESSSDETDIHSCVCLEGFVADVSSDTSCMVTASPTYEPTKEPTSPTVSPTDAPTKEPTKTPDTLSSGGSLRTDQTLVSPNGRARFVVQADGNMVVYRRDEKVLWESGKRGDGSRLVMQDDGNLVQYDDNDQVIWKSNTHDGKRLVMQDDCNLVLYDSGTGAPWASGSSCGSTSTPTAAPTSVHDGSYGKSIAFLHDMQCRIDLIFSIHSLISTPYPGTHPTPVRRPHRGTSGTPLVLHRRRTHTTTIPHRRRTRARCQQRDAPGRGN
jgi:hypothetical protein